MWYRADWLLVAAGLMGIAAAVAAGLKLAAIFLSSVDVVAWIAVATQP